MVKLMVFDRFPEAYPDAWSEAYPDKLKFKTVNCLSGGAFLLDVLSVLLIR